MLGRKLSFSLYPKPTGDPGRDRNARTLQFACLLLAFGTAVVASLNALEGDWLRMPTHGLTLALIGAAGVMNRSGKWKWAAWTVTLAVLLNAILLVVQARDGFRSNAMLLFPELLLVSMMLLDRKSYFLTAISILVAVAALGIAERHGLTAAVPGVRTPTTYGSIFFVVLSMLIFGLIGNRIVRDIQSNVVDLRSIIDRISAANAALHESELRYREVFENFSECVWALDVTPERRFRVAWLNPAAERATGRSSVEAAGQFIDDVLPADAAKSAIPHYRQCVEIGTVINFEQELHLPIGDRYFHTNLIPIRDDTGHIHRIVGCCLDFTELKRSQEETFARQKLESVGTLASGIAHDFNNLLGAALAQADLALAEYASGDFPTEPLKAIQNLAIRGSEIVQQLMVYAGNESETLELVNVSLVVGEMRELLKVSVSKHAVLVADLGERLPAVMGNAAQIRRIVMNLVTNASEAIGDRDGIIRLMTRWVIVGRAEEIFKGVAEGEYVELAVTDDGVGMSPETQARIFDPFFTTKSAGRGLGLGVVHGIVRNLGGGIHIASEPGKGTTVHILLPCAEAMAAGTSDSVSDAGRLPRPSQRFAVLVVEDEDLLRQAIVKMLRREGFEVSEAFNGFAAIELLRATGSRIDVILLDMTVPGASSQEVLAEATKARPDIKVILTSAYSHEILVDKISASQVYDFIRKPFRLADLMRMLHNAIRTKIGA